MAAFGYARVSTPDQVLHLQVDALLAAGVPKDGIHTDQVSGSKVRRPGLDALLGRVTTGDTITVWRLDRLGRSLAHLATLAQDLRARGVEIVSLTDGVDTRTSTGRLVLGLLATLAEYEREAIRERVVAGMGAARRRGMLLGRRPSLTDAQVAEARTMLLAGRGVTEVTRLFRTSRASLYRALDRSGEPKPVLPRGRRPAGKRRSTRESRTSDINAEGAITSRD